ncbi:MAG: hypothetical protein HY698_02200 [Deltaproteobacteria bacterium]|nr:hypothetical protein [Deltaproteobacteria bacterium]
MHLNVAATCLLAASFAASLLAGRFRFTAILPLFRPWYGFLLLWGGWMAASGWIDGQPELAYIADLCATLLFVLGIAIGTSSAGWKIIDSVYPLGLGLLGIPVVLAGIKLVGVSSREDLLARLVYTASVILIPTTYFVLVPSRLGSALHRQFVSWAFLLYGVCQFLFAKRAPLSRVIVVFFFAYWLIPGWTGRHRKWRRLVGLLILGTAVLVSSGDERGHEVRSRFEKLSVLSDIVDSDHRYDDVWAASDAENETFRFREVGYFYDGMTRSQTWLGTGLGGYSSHELVAVRTFVGTLSGDLIPGSTAAHIGMFWAFHKGGAIFFTIFYAGVVVALWRFGKVLKNPLKLNAWAFVFIYLLFSMAEGFWMTPGVEATTFLVGASMGALVTRE